MATWGETSTPCRPLLTRLAPSVAAAARSSVRSSTRTAAWDTDVLTRFRIADQSCSPHSVGQGSTLQMNCSAVLTLLRKAVATWRHQPELARQHTIGMYSTLAQQRCTCLHAGRRVACHIDMNVLTDTSSRCCHSTNIFCCICMHASLTRVKEIK